MQVGFPPSPVYPIAIDSDRTLFLVYNTAEAQTTSNNQAWSDEVAINPVADDAAELWADNGFANITGELFYYDSVEKNNAGKVNKLIRCARNLGGKHTTFNPVGTWVRGFVVAEHHNQIAGAILNLEDFIGIDFSEIRPTLDWRIRNLAALPDCIDDHDCPDVDFGYITLAETSCEGTIIEYNTKLIGSYNTFKIDFGDGNTSTELSGSHTYAPGAIVDPIVTVGNDKCEIVQSPNIRTNPEEPKQTVPVIFEIPLPQIPPFPTISIPSITIPSTDLTLPPIVFPCLDVGPIGSISIPSIIIIEPPINIPSVISFTPLIIPSLVFMPSFAPISFVGDNISITFNPVSITFGSLTFPSTISIQSISVTVNIPSVISITPVNIPSVITVNDNIPTTITVTDNIPSVISFGPLTIPSMISITTPSFTPISFAALPPITFEPPPAVTVDWGSPPTITGTVTVTCGGAMAAQSQSANFADIEDVDSNDFQDAFKQSVNFEAVEWAIPSEIRLIAPKIPDIKIAHDIPNTIEIIAPNIPNKIEIIAPKQAIPSKIEIVGNIPTEIRVVAEGLPDIIELDGSKIPESIRIELPEFPTISIDASGIPKTIEVTGIPDSIEIKGQIPSEIFIKAPENLEVPLVYRGGPIPIQLDMRALSGENGEETPCFALVPCPRK